MDLHVPAAQPRKSINALQATPPGMALEGMLLFWLDHKSSEE